MRIITGALLFGLTACGSAPIQSPSAAPAQGLVPDQTGLKPNASPLRIDFGRDRDGVVQAVNKLLGSPPTGQAFVPGCGEVITWKTGLNLTFVESDFRGWRDDQRAAGQDCSKMQSPDT